MASLHSIFQDIALMISDHSEDRILLERIRNKTFDWEKIVSVASSHLIIPLLYYKLKEKHVLDLLPGDLRSYLEEIARQNSERNKTILKEVKDLSIILNSKKIDHVFLKGSAMLASGIYTNIGERMIGDIDILVHPDQLFKAQDLLIKNNYQAIETTFGQNFVEHKHLARLIPDRRLAAVEIHRKLLHRRVKGQLDPISILSQKHKIGGVFIPSFKDLLVHAVLNFEINDYGYYYNYLGLRNTYDALKLSEKLSNKELEVINRNLYYVSFFTKVSQYFQPQWQDQRSLSAKLSTKFYLLKQKNRLIRTLTYKFLNIWQFGRIILKRFFLFIRDSDYRKEVIKDRKRIHKLISYKIKTFY